MWLYIHVFCNQNLNILCFFGLFIFCSIFLVSFEFQFLGSTGSVIGLVLITLVLFKACYLPNCHLKIKIPKINNSPRITQEDGHCHYTNFFSL